MSVDLSDPELRAQIHSLQTRLHDLYVERQTRQEQERDRERRAMQQQIGNALQALQERIERCQLEAKHLVEQFPRVPELGDLGDCFAEATGTIQALLRPVLDRPTVLAQEEEREIEF